MISVDKIVGFGVPLEDLNPNSRLLKFLDGCSFYLARLWPRMFAFQFVAMCTKEKDTDDLIEQTFK